MPEAKYKDISLSDFKEFDQVPPHRTWSVKLIEDFLAQSKYPVIGKEMETEEEVKNRILTINASIRKLGLTDKVGAKKQGTSLFIYKK